VVLQLAGRWLEENSANSALSAALETAARFYREPTAIIDLNTSARSELAREFERLAARGVQSLIVPAAGAVVPEAIEAVASLAANELLQTGNLVELKTYLLRKAVDFEHGVRIVGIDRFPLRLNSLLVEHHQLITRFLADVPRHKSTGEPCLDGSVIGKEVLESLMDGEGALVVAAAERASVAVMLPVLSVDAPMEIYQGRSDSLGLVRQLLRRRPQFSRKHLFDTVLFLSAAIELIGRGGLEVLGHLVDSAEQYVGQQAMCPGELSALLRLRAATIDVAPLGRVPLLAERLSALIGDHSVVGLVPGEAWSDCVNSFIGKLDVESRTFRLALLSHALASEGSKPTAKWLMRARSVVDGVGPAKLSQITFSAFSDFDLGRSVRVLDLDLCGRKAVNELMHPDNANCLRGWVWTCPLIASPEIVRALGKLALSGYRKVQGVGPRAIKVANAAVYALSAIGSREAVGQLAVLKARVKFGTALKEIEKAYVATAAKLNLPVDEIEEMAVPAYGLSGVGVCEEPMGEFTARLTVAGDGSTELIWLKPDAKPQKSVPVSVKSAHAEELKELQAAAKDIQRMLPAQRERLDGLFLAQKSWPLAVWRERYLDHPLVGVLARRLIWEFTTDGKTTAGMFQSRSSRPEKPDPPSRKSERGGAKESQSLVTSAPTKGEVVDLDLRFVTLGDSTVVRLWHPIGKDVDEVVAWRGWLESQQIQQPFKQAHREVYVVTDAERRTRTYSNRFAAHILRQHQFNALCAARGWKNKLRLMVDAEYPPASRLLPQWGLRAEFWIKGVGDNYGTDTAESGAFLRVATDQVKFYEVGSRNAEAGSEGAEPLPLGRVPPLVFSEIMRDVDLFVGVASVGNDPTWNDGGPEGRFRDYWQSYSFGDLSTTAQTRKAILERLVPRLKIADRCSFADKFLVVRGQLRSYQIHLGSGNILMTPNDQYLCIVPKQSAAAGDGNVFLPFEGDGLLSVILSKAFLLAADDRITDATIVSQLKR
jgi:hypothetical protein